MSEILLVSDTRRDEIIADAVRRTTPIVLTRHDERGWSVCKSRFAGCDAADRTLFIEEPGDADSGPFAPVCGELLGVTFRRGHKKCLFSGEIVEASCDRIGEAGDRPVFALRWPDELQELQRRVYQRAAPPPDRPVKVLFWRIDGEGRGHDESSGVLEDLSAGGVRVACPTDANLEEGDNVRVALCLRSGAPTVVAETRFRHGQARPDGRQSLGFQFVGLELSRDGRQSLSRIARIVTDFQRAALRRKSGRLRSHR